MALVSTVAASTSNSYVTRAEADLYFQLGMHDKSLTWFKLDAEDKDQYLIKATLTIDSQKLRGSKYTTTATSGVPDQRLHFPRGEDYDDSTTFIPLDVKLATYEQAIYFALSGGSTTRAQLQAQGVTSVTIGDVSESYAGDTQTSGAGMLAPLAKQILLKGGYIRRGGQIV